MSNTNPSSLTSPPYFRRTVVPGFATQVSTLSQATECSDKISNITTTPTIEQPLLQKHEHQPKQEEVPTNSSEQQKHQQLLQPQQQQQQSPGSSSSSNTAASCPGSPMRRVSSSIKNSAMDFASRFFNKCKAATFTVDGATYTIGKETVS